MTRRVIPSAEGARDPMVLRQTADEPPDRPYILGTRFRGCDDCTPVPLRTLVPMWSLLSCPSRPYRPSLDEPPSRPYVFNIIPTGQWSEPMTSGRMNAFLSDGRSPGVIQK